MNSSCEGFDWCVTHYSSGDYDGSGEAYAFKDGPLFSGGLGHCSCYGPLDSGWDKGVPVSDFLRDVTCAPMAEVDAKIKELLGLDAGEAEPFLATIRANPNEPGPVGVYADWLEERGDGDAVTAMKRYVQLEKQAEQRRKSEER